MKKYKTSLDHIIGKDVSVFIDFYLKQKIYTVISLRNNRKRLSIEGDVEYWLCVKHNEKV